MMPKIHTIDLHFLTNRSIAAYVVESSDGPILVETGPHSTYERLTEACKALGFSMSDFRHVLLTHIHFDHAGAAWAIAAHGAKVYVHPLGYKHLKDPTRLYNSAKIIYKDQMETLWGIMKSIPEEQLISVAHQTSIQIGEHKWTAWHTPGHARHHIAWQLDSQVFSGDVGGVLVGDGPVVPPCPPPDIDLEAWKESIDLLTGLNLEALYLTHFGKVGNVVEHLQELEKILWDWALWIKDKMEQGLSQEDMVATFEAYDRDRLVSNGVDSEALKSYSVANPARFSVAGLARYWEKKVKT
ncbi:MAG: MBL fold metallo-hydrolase [Bacteroidota bacterium]